GRPPGRSASGHPQLPAHLGGPRAAGSLALRSRALGAGRGLLACLRARPDLARVGELQLRERIAQRAQLLLRDAALEDLQQAPHSVDRIPHLVQIALGAGRAGAVQVARRSMASRAGYSSPRSRSISRPSSPKRVARQRFSSISRGAGSVNGTRSSTSRTACAMQAAISEASASDSGAVACTSQMRTSTVPKLKCGRTDHQTWVNSTIERVRIRNSMYSR